MSLPTCVADIMSMSLLTKIEERKHWVFAFSENFERRFLEITILWKPLIPRNNRELNWKFDRSYSCCSGHHGYTVCYPCTAFNLAFPLIIFLTNYTEASRTYHLSFQMLQLINFWFLLAYVAKSQLIRKKHFPRLQKIRLVPLLDIKWI